jgi:hypothetical protein
VDRGGMVQSKQPLTICSRLGLALVDNLRHDHYHRGYDRQFRRVQEGEECQRRMPSRQLPLLVEGDHDRLRRGHVLDLRQRECRRLLGRMEAKYPSNTIHEVRAYIPCNYATTWRAPYQIVSNGTTTNVIVDQLGLCNQWIGLGVYSFSSGTAGYVRITDATGESGSTSRQIGVDAVSFQPVYVGPFEAENYRGRFSRSGLSWELRTLLSGYFGSGYMQALPNSGMTYDTGYTTTSPELQFQVVLPVTGTYYIWLRGYGGNSNDDSLHAGIDGQGSSSADRITGCGWSGAGWIWCNSTSDGPRATLYGTWGLHTINLWMREDGFRVDRLLLAADSGFTP